MSLFLYHIWEREVNTHHLQSFWLVVWGDESKTSTAHQVASGDETTILMETFAGGKNECFGSRGKEKIPRFWDFQQPMGGLSESCE